VADLGTISALATAGGTLILAIATFASIRSANRSARTAERALLAGLRPVLMSSRLQDDEQKVGFQDNKWFRVQGGTAIAEVTDDAIYLIISLRNVGSGMAILHGWIFVVGDPTTAQAPTSNDPTNFRRLTRDLYIPPHETGFWQGAFRDPSSAEFKEARAAIENHDPFYIELLYGDHEGGQRVITRFAFLRRGEDGYLSASSRHWNLDRSDPR
jgi:hypothetical protein